MIHQPQITQGMIPLTNHHSSEVPHMCGDDQMYPEVWVLLFNEILWSDGHIYPLVN